VTLQFLKLGLHRNVEIEYNERFVLLALKWLGFALLYSLLYHVSESFSQAGHGDGFTPFTFPNSNPDV